MTRQKLLPKPPRGYPNPILQADRVRAVAATMSGATHAQIGATLDMSSNWIGDLLRLLRCLPAAIKDYVRGLGPCLHRSQVTGMDLRRIANLKDGQAQFARFDQLLIERRLPSMKWAAAIENEPGQEILSRYLTSIERPSSSPSFEVPYT